MSTNKAEAAGGTIAMLKTLARRTSAKPRAARKPAKGSKPGGSRIVRTAQAIGKQVSDNPLTALAGAAAVTAGIALLLPSSRREAEVMGDIAGKIGEAARDVADGAVEAGRQHVAELAQAALGSVGGNVVESLIGAASTEPAAANREG